MMAAGTAAQNGHHVLLLEKNDRPGRKLRITGKGRCNITNASDTDALMAKVNVNARFLYSAFNAYSSEDVQHFFEENGVPLKTERGQRVFPVSDRAADVAQAMEAFVLRSGAKLQLNTAVSKIETLQGQVRGVVTNHGFLAADAVVVATGGLSYPATGSTGDGYGFARAAGHKVTPLYPSLASIIAAEAWIPPLAGLSLKNVRVTVARSGKILYEDQGELLFTHNGVSGPLILSASRFVTGEKDRSMLSVSIDLKPALSHVQLDERIQRDFQEHINKDFKKSLDGLLPKRLIELIIQLSGIAPERKVHTITKEERLRLGGLLKNLSITPKGAAGYNEAVVTMGGVDVREINPSTLMSKKIQGLFFVGEVLDVDAMTGGYNLQIAFSTGYLAGRSIL